MLRLAIVGADAAGTQSLRSRLRPATIHADAADAEAVVFLDTSLSAEIEHALNAGKPVLIAAHERLTKNQVQTWTELARHHNARLSIANPGRFLPSRQLIRQQLDAGKLGEPGLVRIHRWGGAGNLLCDLDLIVWLFAKPANLVYAIQNDDCTQIHLGFPGGGMALLDHAMRLPVGDRYCSLSVIGASGAAYADDHQNMQVVFRGGPAQAVRAEEGIVQWSAMVQHFVDHVDRVEASWDPVLELNDAVAQSMRTRQAVPV